MSEGLKVERKTFKKKYYALMYDARLALTELNHELESQGFEAFEKNYK